MHYLSTPTPVVSCFTLPIDELVQRQNFAYERAKAQAQTEGADAEDARAIASMTLWHSEFSNGLYMCIRDNELFRVAADLPGELLVANGMRELDFYDYGYVADVLRERLASSVVTAGDAQNLRRALAWVEQTGAALLPSTHASMLPMVAQTTPTPMATAA